MSDYVLALVYVVGLVVAYVVVARVVNRDLRPTPGERGPLSFIVLIFAAAWPVFVVFAAVVYLLGVVFREVTTE